MTRNLLIASGVLIAAVLLLYLLVLRPKPEPDNPVARLAAAAEQMCLSNTSSTNAATIQSQLATIKGLSASATAGTTRSETRGAVVSLSDTLKAEQDDKIRACMQPYTEKMLTLIH